MRSIGGNGKEEWLLQLQSLVDQSQGLVVQDVSRVIACPADGRILVSLCCGIQILIGEGIEQEVRAGPSSRVGLVIVVGRVEVEELSKIVSAVTRLL